jgi:hypothetical protein
VGIVARISGCADQKELSLDDQVDHAKEIVREMYVGPVEYRTIQTKGKGEDKDRPELADLEAMLRSDELDLLLFEDLGRVVRGTTAVDLLGIAVNHGVRCISPNDCIDTIESTWEEDAISACRDHVGHNAHTSKRIQHKMMNRFKKFGGATARPTSGYILPPGSKTYDDWRRNEAATPIIQRGAEMLLSSGNCSAVADYFNEANLAIRKHRKSRNSWNGKKVRQFYRCTILKGMPSRGHRRSVKNYETGKRVSVKNPDGACYREYPHLSHLDPDMFDKVNALLDLQNKNRGRKAINGKDPLAGLSRKRTHFPGHCATCGYCGHKHVWGGNGVTDSMMCVNSREYHCWNSIAFNGRLATTKVVAAITDWLYTLPDFETQLARMIGVAERDRASNLPARRAELNRKVDSIAREKQNVLDSIAAFGPRPMLKEKLDQIDAEQRDLGRLRRELELTEHESVNLPRSIQALRPMFLEKFQNLAWDSFELADLLRQIICQFEVRLVRLIDGGHLLPRARVIVDLSGMLQISASTPELEKFLRREFTLDLFEPPQREAIREASVALAVQGLTHGEIAAKLPGAPTKTAVTNAIALDRMMRAMSLDSPFVLVEERPDNYSKLRRHKHARYQFMPLPGFTPLLQ